MDNIESCAASGLRRRGDGALNGLAASCRQICEASMLLMISLFLLVGVLGVQVRVGPCPVFNGTRGSGFGKTHCSLMRIQAPPFLSTPKLGRQIQLPSIRGTPVGDRALGPLGYPIHF